MRVAANRLLAVLAAPSVIGATAEVATSGTPRQCVVPRLFAVTLPAAKASLAASGCRVGAIAFERAGSGVVGEGAAGSADFVNEGDACCECE
jgi:hypothetical protein